MASWRTPLFSALIALAALGQGEAQPGPDTPEQAADQVLVAFEADDEAALEALAEKAEPDPWLVADQLCSRGEHDAAEAFALAAPHKDTEKLPAYVASRRGKGPSTAARDALAAASEALAADDATAALLAIESVDAEVSDVASVRLHYGRGAALRSLRRLEESAAAFLAAADAAERLGWLARAGVALDQSGISAYYGSDRRGALQAWERRLAVEERRGNRAAAAATLGNIGIIHQDLGDYARALECQERSQEIEKEMGNRAGMARTLGNIGVIHCHLGDYARALGCYEQAVRLKDELGDRAGAAATLGNIGVIHYYLGDYARALDCYERARNAMEELGDRAGAATMLGNIGIIHQGLGDHARALVCQERALKLQEELGDRAGAAKALGNIGVIHRSLGDYPKALEYQERALKVMEELGVRAGVATTLMSIGNIHQGLGDCAKALDYEERALKMMEELGDRAGAARTLGSIGIIHQSLGDYAKALDVQERSLKMMEELGDRLGVAGTLGNIGNTHRSLGNYAKALDCQERALKLKEELGDRAEVAVSLGNIGLVHLGLGDYAKALDFQERALKLKEELGDRAGAAGTLGSIGVLHESLGDFAKALDFQERALALASELAALEIEVITLGNLAALHQRCGRYAEAAQAARRGVGRLPLLVGRLAEEQGATARGRWAGLMETGVRAGVQLQDAAEVSFFLESGRAGTLLESLGGRKALGNAAIPPELRREESEARAAVLEAQARHGRALAAGKLKEIGEARAAVDAAHGKMLDAVARIQRTAKAAADVAYPKAAPLEAIRGSLAGDETLVLYALLSEEAVALVVTAERARIVALGKTEEIEAALSAWSPEDPAEDPSPSRVALRQQVVAPLGLDPTKKRLLVSPEGRLAYVPFPLLAEGREVVYVPSGTTYNVLREEARVRGEGVLALGDPDYGAKRNPLAELVLARGGPLVPVPGTGVEAKAVGDTVLLGREATETGLARALAKRARWRAIHLACHGLLDPERPLLSSLALTSDDGEDGFLATNEVFRMRVPADLVVLSACETARGRVYRSEGVVGFTRAFIFAGAPRIIVSLWKVDDEATRALMVKFYELWNPKGGSRGMPTATALKKAQEYVRDHPDHPEWRHPFYWAAWQLWGLPD